MNKNEPLPFDNYDLDSLVPGLAAADPMVTNRFGLLCAPKLEGRGMFFGLSQVLARAWAERCIEAMTTVMPERVAEVKRIGLRRWVLEYSARMILPAPAEVGCTGKLGRDMLALRVAIDRWVTHLSPLQQTILKNDIDFPVPNDARLADELGVALTQIQAQRELALVRLIQLMMGDEAVSGILRRMRAAQAARGAGN